jgi:hypothetical protein
MKFREANKVDRKSGGSPIKGLSFLHPAINGYVRKFRMSPLFWRDVGLHDFLGQVPNPFVESRHQIAADDRGWALG